MEHKNSLIRTVLNRGWLLVAIVLVVSCVPVNSSLVLSQYDDVEKFDVQGQSFIHSVYVRKGRDVTASGARQRLNIYLGGDGTPWINGNIVAEDPTPRHAVTPNLFLQDPSAAVFVGRPCYYRSVLESACDKRYWTSARYSAEVVNSIAAVIKSIIKQYAAERIFLIGYSGGGVLAVLVAQHVEGLDGVLTVGANLDIDHWTQYHGYLPLKESINPILQSNLRKDIGYWHWVGSDDRVVPAVIVSSFVERHGGQLKIAPKYDHVCCWEKKWREILNSTTVE